MHAYFFKVSSNFANFIIFATKLNLNIDFLRRYPLFDGKYV